MAEEVIIKIELEKGENERQVDQFTKKITDLTKANNDLKKSNNELIKSGQENSKEFIENTRQMEINKQKIQEATASRKNLITTLIAEDDSIKGLKARNAELLKQRDQLSTSTADGQQKIAAINKELDTNNKKITENSSALEKQRFNIGNYKSALDGLIPGLGGMIDGIQGATKAAYAFIATPLGLILAGIALALSTVIGFLTDTEEGMDLFGETSAQVSAIIDVLWDRIKLLGGALIKFAQGDFAGGIDNVTEAFTGLGDELEREVALAKELAQRFDILEDLNVKLTVRLAEQENAIKNLIIQSRNRGLSEEERIKKLQEASAIEKQLTGERIALRVAEINAIATQIQMGNSQLIGEQKAGETTIEFAKRIVENDKVLLSDRQKIADQLVTYNGLLDNQANIQDKIQNQQNAIAEKAEAAAEKRAENERKRQEKALADAVKHQEELAALDDASDKAQQERFERIRTAEQSLEETRLQQKIKDAEDLTARTQAEIDLENFKLQAFLDSNVLFQAEKEAAIAKSEANITAIRKKSADEQAKNDKAAAEKTAQVEKLTTEGATRGREAAARAAVGFARGAFGQTREVAVAESIVNTILAVSRAYKDYQWPFNLIVSALMGGLGAIQTARIAGVTFARGGMLSQIGGVLQGRSHAQGGIPFTLAGQPGFEAEGGEAIINKRSTQMFRPLLSQINEAGGGVAFGHGGVTKFQGGSVTQAASQVAQSRQQLKDSMLNFLENMPPIIVTVEDINAKATEVAEQTNRAVVI